MNGARGRTRRVSSAITRSYALVRRAGGRLLWFTFVVGFIGSAAVAVELLLIRQIVDRFESGSSAASALIALGVLAALRRLVNSAGSESQWLVAERVEQSVLTDVLEIAGQSPYADFESPEFQDSMSRAIRAGKEDVWGAAWGLFQLVTSLTAIVTLVVILITVASELLVPFAVAGLGLAVVAMFKSRLSYAFDYADTAADRERRYLRDALVSRSEGREIRLFGTGSQLRRRHHDLFATRIANLKGLLRRRLAADAATSLALGIVLALVLVFIGRSVDDGTIELSTAAVAAVAAHQLTGALSRLFSGLGGVLEATRHVADLDSFLLRPVSPEPSARRDAPRSITVDNATFRYPGAPDDALRGVTIELPVGGLVAVVGENGSGKTTLGRLILGLYSPTSGAVNLVDHAGAPTPVTGPLVGVASAAFQDFAKYELSVTDNVALGSSGTADEERVERMLAGTGLASVVEALPSGRNTRLGRRFVGGLDISIGQWQRLALARAAYNPSASFVVLDEPSAALDPQMEAALFDRLREIFPEQGVLLISHRMASVHNADLIVVMHEGVIAEQGTHEELLILGGIYSSLYHQQVQRLGITKT